MPRAISAKTADAIDVLTQRYPTRMAAMLPALHLVQDEIGHIPDDAAYDVAEILDVPPTRVHEVITFYTMFYSRPVGRNVVKICRNLGCALRGSDELIALAKEKLGIELGETTDDGRVTLDTDECLASCGTGPMLWHRCRKGESDVQEGLVENLTREKLEAFLTGLS